MSRERSYHADAIILRRADFGEADRILTVFTPERGKLRLMAKGVRKTTSRKAGHIELFMLTNMLVARGQTWDIISQAEVVQTYRDLREDLEKTSQAYYLAELIDSFTEEHDVNAPLFELLAFTLAHLSHLADASLLLRYFELRLLSLTGFQPQLHFCLVCNQPLAPVENYFHFGDGGMLCPEHGKNRPNTKIIPLPTLKVLRFLQTQSWEKVATLQLNSQTYWQIESLLLGYITFLLEHRLKSVDFIYRLRKEKNDKSS